jgi:hypothetical protein
LVRRIERNSNLSIPTSDPASHSHPVSAGKFANVRTEGPLQITDADEVLDSTFAFHDAASWLANVKSTLAAGE